MELNFSKSPDGLLPAIIQDAQTKTVLMLGYMDAAALEKTQTTGQVTFYSRSKQRLWTKGEESGNFLQVVEVKADCDQDTVLIQASPKGPTCHKGTDTRTIFLNSINPILVMIYYSISSLLKHF